jgi:hypothetical protein
MALFSCSLARLLLKLLDTPLVKFQNKHLFWVNTMIMQFHFHHHHHLLLLLLLLLLLGGWEKLALVRKFLRLHFLFYLGGNVRSRDIR